jgi:adenylate cyclase
MVRWLLTEGRLLTDLGALIDGLCGRIIAAGTPLLRSNAQLRTQHPEVSMTLHAWRRHEVAVEQQPTRSVRDIRFRAYAAGVVQVLELDHSAFENAAYRDSPFHTVTETGRTVRCAIARDQTVFAFPLLADLHAMGATEYVCVPLTFARGPLSAISFTTDRPGGFDAAFLDGMDTWLPALAMCMELHSARHITRSLLTTYLGAEPGQRVLDGQFVCGDVRRLEAAVWFSDLRGFTALSSRSTSKQLVETLNAYFAAITAPLGEHGGEVLKYVGDAVLAVFPVREDRDAAAACASALAAAHAASARLAALNEARAVAGEPPLDHGIGLHFGEAEYGNVGSPGRLDFTVIGRDVNLASRVEGLCGRLGRRVLASSVVAGYLPDVGWEPVGTFELKGIAASQAVFAPR